MSLLFKFLVIITLALVCAEEPERNLTAEFRAMNWTQLRDYVYNNVPTTTESVVHHYVQKIAHGFEGLEEKVKTSVRSEVNDISEGAWSFFNKCMFGGGILLAIIACIGSHICCTIYKTERETQRHLSKAREPADVAEMCV